MAKRTPLKAKDVSILEIKKMKKVFNALHSIPFIIIFSPFIIAALVFCGIWWLLFGWMKGIDDSDYNRDLYW